MDSRTSRPCKSDSPADLASPRGGFTMVEVIFAIMILAIGLMGMAGTTALVVRQVTMADLATERSVALQTTLEQLQATPFDRLADGSDSVGIYRVDWDVTVPTGWWAQVEIVTTGPGLAENGSSGLAVMPNVPDTFVHRILR